MIETSHNSKTHQLLNEIYRRLFARYGPQHWWPGDTPFEVMVGAVLTQSCSWKNVEKAIVKLKGAGLLSPQALRDVPEGELANLIHSCGYYNVKAKKLKALVNWLDDYCRDDIDSLPAVDIMKLRRDLLSIYGIGEETADSILLYACGKPIFVIDAYTRRILHNIRMMDGDSYDDFQALFMTNLSLDAAMFNEYHALFVAHGKDVCKKTPQCSGCCLQDICRAGKEALNRNY